MKKYQPPSDHYFRMYNKVFDLNLKATTFLLYSYLVCCSGNKGSCWPSLETISRKTGLSVSTVQEHLKILEQRKLISKSRHRTNGGWGKNNVYALLSLDNPEVYRSTAPLEELPLHIGDKSPVQSRCWRCVGFLPNSRARTPLPTEKENNALCERSNCAVAGGDSRGFGGEILG